MTTQFIIKKRETLPTGQVAARMYILEKGKYESHIILSRNKDIATNASYRYIQRYVGEKLIGLAESRYKAYDIKGRLNETKVKSTQRILNFGAKVEKMDYASFLLGVNGLISDVKVMLPNERNAQTDFCDALECWINSEMNIHNLKA